MAKKYRFSNENVQQLKCRKNEVVLFHPPIETFIRRLRYMVISVDKCFPHLD